MSNKYLVTNTTQLTTTAVSMDDYLEMFGLRPGTQVVQEIHERFGNDVKKLLEIDLNKLTISAYAKRQLRIAIQKLREAIDIDETADDVVNQMKDEREAEAMRNERIRIYLKDVEPLGKMDYR